MNYYIHDGELYNQEELQHYGVIGMKWGVRKDPSKAYKKAVKKADKIDAKRARYAKKASKYSEKLSKPSTYRRYKKMLRYTRRFHKFNAKASKMEAKGDKWVKEMEKAFNTVRTKEIAPEVLDAGKKFAYMLVQPYKTTKTNIGSNKNVDVHVDAKNDADAKVARKFITSYDDKSVRNSIAKDYYDNNKPWVNDDPATSVTRAQFTKNLKLVELAVDVPNDTYSALYTDGGAYYGHWINVEGSIKDKKYRQTSLYG